MPQDSVEERYLSLGSQSTLMKLKEAILRAQGSIRCAVDSWGLHLIQECSEELETVCRQDVEVRVVASVPAVLPTFPFASSRLKIRYGKHMSGRSAFMIDNGEVLLVNSQTGRGFQFMLGELRGAFGDDLFEEFWKSSTGSKTLASISNADNLPFLIDAQGIGRLFIEAVTRVVKDEAEIEEIGHEFLKILEERGAPKLNNESFENAVRLILALMQEEARGGGHGGVRHIDADIQTRAARISGGHAELRLVLRALGSIEVFRDQERAAERRPIPGGKEQDNPAQVRGHELVNGAPDEHRYEHQEPAGDPRQHRAENVLVDADAGDEIGHRLAEEPRQEPEHESEEREPHEGRLPSHVQPSRGAPLFRI